MIRGMSKANARVLHRDINASIHNRFDIEVVDAKTGEIKQRAQAENTICNNLWEALMVDKYNGYFTYLQYGSGFGTPSSTDTTLFQYKGSILLSNASYSIADEANIARDFLNGVIYTTSKGSIDETVAVGTTLTEVGISYQKTSGGLCTHAVLKDMNNNPVSIQKTDKDIINFYATVYVHYNPFGYDDGHIWLVPKTINPNTVWKSGLDKWLLGLIRPMPLVYLYASDSCYFDDTRLSTKLTPQLDIEHRTVTWSYRFGAGTSNFPNSGIQNLGAAFSGLNEKSPTPNIVITPGGTWFKESKIVSEALGTGDGATKDFSPAFPLIHDVTVYVDGKEVSSQSEYSVMTNDYTHILVPILKESTPQQLLKVPFFTNNSQIYIPDGIVYNPYYNTIGVSSITRLYSKDFIQVSNDLNNWITIEMQSLTIIPEEYQNYPFWKFSNTIRKNAITFSKQFPVNTIHLDEAPAEGSVITVDYTTDCIAKDTNHVFDISVTLHLGEYTEAQ